ncbi:MAG: Rieske 2Fe-2S domain-containing protein, partial [Nitrospirota bacterium]|nr:Rieske 2Fe-2S domain-containing protein [Nitrospirota bacterium]
RANDQEMDSEAQRAWRERWGTPLVVFCFLVAILGGVGFLIFYWSGRNNTALLGGSLALFLGGMGVTLVVWARWLMSDKQAVEPRHALQSASSQREATAKAFCGGAHDVRRRRLLTWMGLSGAGLFGAMALSLMRSLGLSPDTSLYSRIWQGGQRLVTLDGKPVSLGTLQPGSTVTVFPEDKIGNERAQTVLIRVKEDLLQLPEDRASWAPGGYVAYSRVCTHAGCPVGEYQAEQSLLLCPCHQSTFDVLRAAAPTGGPAARALPQLPLYADADGTLRAGGGFTAPPGPGFWGIS